MGVKPVYKQTEAGVIHEEPTAIRRSPACWDNSISRSPSNQRAG